MIDQLEMFGAPVKENEHPKPFYCPNCEKNCACNQVIYAEEETHYFSVYSRQELTNPEVGEDRVAYLENDYEIEHGPTRFICKDCSTEVQKDIGWQMEHT